MLSQLLFSSQPQQSFAPVALADDAHAEQAQQETPYMNDADRFYAAECDRDLALSYLDAELPAGCGFHLSATENTYRTQFGTWKTERVWAGACKMSADAPAFATVDHATPAEAAAELVKLYRLQAGVADAAASVTAAERSRIGTIDPRTAADLLELFTARVGRNDFALIDTAGNVTLPVGLELCDGELAALRGYVAEHNAAVANVPAVAA